MTKWWQREYGEEGEELFLKKSYLKRKYNIDYNVKQKRVEEKNKGERMEKTVTALKKKLRRMKLPRYKRRRRMKRYKNPADRVFGV